MRVINLRFWKLGIKFFSNSINIPAISIIYWDGGIELQIYKSIMRFDWGYFASEWRIYDVVEKQ